MNELKWTKSNGTYNTEYNGHKLRIKKNDCKDWSLMILKRNDRDYTTEYTILWDDLKTLKEAKEEASYTNLEF